MRHRPGVKYDAIYTNVGRAGGKKKYYLPLVETESKTEESKWDAEKAAYLWPMAPPKNDDIPHDDMPMTTMYAGQLYAIAARARDDAMLPSMRPTNPQSHWYH